MAWRTIGTSNTDMCEKLGEIGIIKNPHVMSAFLNVDRGLFAYGKSNYNTGTNDGNDR